MVGSGRIGWDEPIFPVITGKIFPVITGLDPVIYRGTVLVQMAGSSLATTIW